MVFGPGDRASDGTFISIAVVCCFLFLADTDAIDATLRVNSSAIWMWFQLYLRMIPAAAFTMFQVAPTSARHLQKRRDDFGDNSYNLKSRSLNACWLDEVIELYPMPVNPFLKTRPKIWTGIGQSGLVEDANNSAVSLSIRSTFMSPPSSNSNAFDRNLSLIYQRNTTGRSIAVTCDTSMILVSFCA